MSTAIAVRQSNPRMRKAPAIAGGFVLWAQAATVGTVTTDPRLEWGTGAPNHTAPQYSVFIRTDASDSDLVFYRNTDGAATWETIVGSELTDLLAANNVWTGTQAYGVDGTGVDVTFFGDTASRRAVWDQSEDTLRFDDNTKLGWGSGAGTTPDIGVLWNGTKLLVSQLTANSAIDLGVDGAGIDLVLYGDTASVNATWDQSADSFVFNDNAKIVLGTGSDDTVSHNGTDTLWTHAVGDLIFDNTDTNDQIILRVGTDTTATGVEIRNNSDVAIWNFRPTSATAGSLKGADASALVFGDGDDIAIAWDATKLAITQAAVNSAIHLGISGAGIDLNLFGDTVAADCTWDQSADSLIFGDNARVVFGTGSDITFLWDATDLLVSQALADSSIKWGVSGAGINHVFYGDTATRDMTWDQSNDQLLFNDNAKLAIGTGAGAAGDITFAWDGTKMVVAQLTANSAVEWGVDGAGIDHVFYGDTAGAKMTWDQSADKLLIGGAASVQGLRTSSSTAAAISGATALTLADSGGVFSVAQSSTFDIDVPDPTTGPGCRYQFVLTATGAFSPTITSLGAATFIGHIQIDGATVVATGSTLTFVNGSTSVGDSVEIISLSTSLYFVRAFASAAGGITIT